MAQMFAYESKPGEGGWLESLFFCTLATFVDGAVTVAIYGFLKLLMKP